MTQFKYNPLVHDKIDLNTNVPVVRVISDPEYERSLGLLDYIDSYKITGHNPAFSGAYEDVIPQGGLNIFPTTAETIRVKAAGNAADDAAGLGARTVKVLVLDEDWIIQLITLTTAGILASAPSIILVRRILDFYVDTVGTYGGNNTGAITIENTAATQVLGVIAANISTSHSSVFTIPADKFGKIDSIILSASNSNSTDIRFNSRIRADDNAAPFSPTIVGSVFTDVQGVIPIDVKSWPTFTEKTDVWFSGIDNTGPGGASATITYNMLLFDIQTT